MKYVIKDLDALWDLPVCIGDLQDLKGGYCAVGLVVASVFGRDFNFTGHYGCLKTEVQQLVDALDGQAIGSAFDREAARKTSKEQEMIREKYVRRIVNYGVTFGILEVAPVGCTQEPELCPS